MHIHPINFSIKSPPVLQNDSHFDYVPNEILKVILSNLDRLNNWQIFLVCKRWNTIADIALDPSIENNKFLQEVLKADKIFIFQKLLRDRRVEPNTKDKLGMNLITKLSFYQSNILFVQELLKDPRVDPSIDSDKPFRSACARGDVELARELLKDSRVDPSAKNGVSIVYAVLSRNANLVSLLLNDSRLKNDEGMEKAISLAEENKDRELAEKLKTWQKKHNPSKNLLKGLFSLNLKQSH